MKPFNLFFRLFIYLATALTICHPTLPIAATDSLEPQEISRSTNFTFVGCLENGLNYTFIPSSKLKGRSWIKLTCLIPEEEEISSVSLLTQHVLFYGTKQMDRQHLASQLDALGLDIEADSYLQSNQSEKSLQFSLPNSKTETVCKLLGMLYQMAFFPTLKMEDIELARTHLLSTGEHSEKEALTLQCVTAVQLQKFHAQWYRPEHMHLTLIGFDNPQEIISLLSDTFNSRIQFHESLPSQEELPLPLNEKDTLASYLTERVEWTQDNQSLVVDGKIWMREPNWINKSSNGKTLGAILTILGIGGIILAFPIVAPLAILAGGLTTSTGIYFLTSDYLKDPYYVESIRKIDVQKGCAFAYKNSRAGITLTPYERRAFFLQEMVDHPQTLPKLPILLLADLYQLNDPVIAEIFTVDEFNVLTRIKRDFVQQRNQYKFLKELLEKELVALTTPYTIMRDAALLQAEDFYHQNYYVASKYALKIDRDESIAEIKQAFQNNEISLQERDSLIKQAHDYYEACIYNPEFQAGLANAETTLMQMELEIQNTYNYQVELCKQSIQYYQRMDYYKQGEYSLIRFFDQELNSLLATFPVYLTFLPDYLDLRSL